MQNQQKTKGSSKYRINELLNSLPRLEEKKAIRFILHQFEISERTFYNWRKIQEGDSQQIPGDFLILLAQYFGVDVTEMYTTPPTLETVEIKKEKTANSIIENL